MKLPLREGLTKSQVKTLEDSARPSAPPPAPTVRKPGMYKLTIHATKPPKDVRPPPKPGIGYDFNTREFVIEIEGEEVGRLSPEDTRHLVEQILAEDL